MSEKNEFVLKALKEVGFPIVAFFLMYYMCFTAIDANTEAIESLTRVISLMD